MSRQAFINDDMGVVTTLPARAARASRTTINNQVYKVLTGSQKIYDGKPLFTAEHKNILAQGTEISQEAVQSMILALGGHKKKWWFLWGINSRCIRCSIPRPSAHPER